jgi:hypothetical protein
MELEQVLTKYRAFVANMEWHIKVNKPEGAELHLIHEKVTMYNDMIADILASRKSILTRQLEEKNTRTHIRQAFADYMASEGCSCCRREEEHSNALVRLAKLLRMRKYKDGSGIDYNLYTTKDESIIHR